MKLLKKCKRVLLFFSLLSVSNICFAGWDLSYNRSGIFQIKNGSTVIPRSRVFESTGEKYEEGEFFYHTFIENRDDYKNLREMVESTENNVGKKLTPEELMGQYDGAYGTLEIFSREDIEKSELLKKIVEENAPRALDVEDLGRDTISRIAIVEGHFIVKRQQESFYKAETFFSKAFLTSSILNLKIHEIKSEENSGTIIGDKMLRPGGQELTIPLDGKLTFEEVSRDIFVGKSSMKIRDGKEIDKITVSGFDIRFSLDLIDGVFSFEHLSGDQDYVKVIQISKLKVSNPAIAVAKKLSFFGGNKILEIVENLITKDFLLKTKMEVARFIWLLSEGRFDEDGEAKIEKVYDDILFNSNPERD